MSPVNEKLDIVPQADPLRVSRGTHIVMASAQ